MSFKPSMPSDEEPASLGSKLWRTVERLIYFILCRLLHIPFSKDGWEKLMQFAKFALVGCSNVVVSYICYILFLLVFQATQFCPQSDYLIAQIIGYILSIFWSFYWNKKYVFEADESVRWYRALAKSFLSYSFTGVFLNSILAYVWVELLGLSKWIAPILNLLLNIPLNFLLNKLWAFR